jgi:hypothetical protein
MCLTFRVLYAATFDAREPGNGEHAVPVQAEGTTRRRGEGQVL